MRVKSRSLKRSSVREIIFAESLNPSLERMILAGGSLAYSFSDLSMNAQRKANIELR